MARVREIAALALVALAAATVLPQAGWNATAHYALVESIADGTPRIDEHLNQGGDIAYYDGHFYTAKSPGLAFASVPLYAALDAADAVPTEREATEPPPNARAVEETAIWQVNLVVVLAFLALLVLVRGTVDRFFPGAGIAVALMLGLGTMLLPFATSYFSHVPAALLGFAAFALLAPRGRSLGRLPLAAAGALAGFAVFVEVTLVLVAVALGLYATARRPRLEHALLYGGGLLAGLLPLAAYNAWAFGSPFRNGYSNAVAELGSTGHDVIGANDEGFFGLTYPRIDRALDLLFDERGLFVLTPVAVVAIIGLWPLARRGHAREAALVGGLSAGFLLYNASYYLPFGGHTPGPRFLVPLLPFLALPLAAAFRSWPRITLASAALSAFWMISATLAGPLLPPAESPTTWVSRVVDGDLLLGSIVADGRAAEVVFLIPVLLALALVLLPAGAAISAGRARAPDAARAREPS